jgi:hypothetical protein
MELAQLPTLYALSEDYGTERICLLATRRDARRILIGGHGADRKGSMIH